MAIVQYTITNSAEFINIDGVAGTSVAGISYSVNKANILKIVKNTAENSIGIVLLDNTDCWFVYSEVINPSTGVVYISLAAFESSLKSMVSTSTGAAETLISSINGWPGVKPTADAGGSATSIVDADGGFTADNTAVGYLAYNVTEGLSAVVSAWGSLTSVTLAASSVVDWSSDVYSLPQIRRYVIDMNNYTLLALQYNITCDSTSKVYMKIYGTLDPTATDTSDTGWINLSADLLGSDAGLVVLSSTTDTDIVAVSYPIPLLKYMVKFIVEDSEAASAVNPYTIFVKKA